MHADEHAGAMYMTMTMMRPGLFFQREGPGSEPGNSLLCPDETSLRRRLGVDQCRASLLHKQHKQGREYMTMTIVRPGLFFQREGPGHVPHARWCANACLL